MKRSLVLIAVAVSMLFANPVSAVAVGLGDPNDTKGPLDISRIRMGHDDKVVLRMAFQNPVEKWDFAHGNYAQWVLDISGSADYDRSVFLERRRRHNGGRTLYCVVFKANGHPRGKIKAGMNGERVTCRLGDHLLPNIPRILLGFSIHNGDTDLTNQLHH